MHNISHHRGGLPRPRFPACLLPIYYSPAFALRKLGDRRASEVALSSAASLLCTASVPVWAAKDKRNFKPKDCDRMWSNQQHENEHDTTTSTGIRRQSLWIRSVPAIAPSRTRSELAFSPGDNRFSHRSTSAVERALNVIASLRVCVCAHARVCVKTRSYAGVSFDNCTQES
jgi:hypothetical protein